MLVVFSGLPGVGKTTLARGVAERLGAVYLRIDSIERALATCSLGITPADDAGYAAAYAVAADNLALGRTVIADSVNPISLTREAYRAAAEAVGALCVDVEVICSDPKAHRDRVEARRARDPQTPDWAAVTARDYTPWPAEASVLRIDTASGGPADALDRLLATLPS